jgi:hypothetical protein
VEEVEKIKEMKEVNKVKEKRSTVAAGARRAERNVQHSFLHARMKWKRKEI